ncbi:hypothetical protein PROFUN_02215 [Planoprotostelium fungivorum]|uniref:Uncharacterized protein n=1 Tax=Planoprotostelium fungivorum TaxID=1890364 RepID=A0A2P6NZG1_9EUKA|nr:hypothetical protein PROFUN_02215 [Planoprotostelium fungivorum]
MLTFHRILGTQLYKETSRREFRKLISMVQQEAAAVENTISLFTNHTYLAEGIVIFKRYDRTKKGKKGVSKDDREGRVIFSLHELPLRVVFETENGVTVERKTETTLCIGETPASVLSKGEESMIDNAMSSVKNFWGNLTGPAESNESSAQPPTEKGFFSGLFETKEQQVERIKGKYTKESRESRVEKKEPTFFEKMKQNLGGDEEEPKKKEETKKNEEEEPGFIDRMNKGATNIQKEAKSAFRGMVFDSAVKSAMKGLM